jgi:RNA polymerase sigma factor (sigma-70 family)
LTLDGELRGLLEPDADPIEAVLRAALHADFRPIRWAIVRGPVHRGRGGATHRVGTAFMMARHEMEAARDSHERLVILSGDEAADELLADLNPILADLLDGLTERQRTIARLAILQQLRQSEIADRLGVRAATISVSFSRARLRSLQRLVSGIRRVYANAIIGGP